ncbi:hypothetical protein AAU61_08890 [Desulfocarbo indianensis]|nr:hypothetical protein AAU61_08890 [Desulfocarbo indianensis]
MFELMPRKGAGSLDRLRSEMDQLWNRFFASSEMPPMLREATGFSPKVDVKESDEAIEVTAEVPGLKAEDIDVSLTGDILTLKGEKKEEKEEKKGGYHLVERSFGSFSRSFRLPVAVSKDKIKASHKDGVLTLTLPKDQKEATTKIKVKGES